MEDLVAALQGPHPLLNLEKQCGPVDLDGPGSQAQQIYVVGIHSWVVNVLKAFEGLVEEARLTRPKSSMWWRIRQIQTLRRSPSEKSKRAMFRLNIWPTPRGVKQAESVHDEGVQILENLTNNRVWVISPIEGRANVHSESCRELSTKNGHDCFFKRNLVMSPPSRIGKPHDTKKSSEKPATSSTAWNLI